MLVTGGQRERGQATANTAVFDGRTGQWRSIKSMSSPRLKRFAVLLDDGKVLIGGGTPDERTLLPTTEVFDPETESFSRGPEMTEGRYKLPGGFVALPGSRVLIASGGRSAEGSALVLGGYDDQIDLTGLDRVLRIPGSH